MGPFAGLTVKDSEGEVGCVAIDHSKAQTLTDSAWTFELYALGEVGPEVDRMLKVFLRCIYNRKCH